MKKLFFALLMGTLVCFPLSMTGCGPGDAEQTGIEVEPQPAGHDAEWEKAQKEQEEAMKNEGTP